LNSFTTHLQCTDSDGEYWNLPVDKYFHVLTNVERRQTATSKGILLPFELAETMAERTFRFEGPVSGFLSFVRPFESGRYF